MPSDRKLLLGIFVVAVVLTSTLVVQALRTFSLTWNSSGTPVGNAPNASNSTDTSGSNQSRPVAETGQIVSLGESSAEPSYRRGRDFERWAYPNRTVRIVSYMGPRFVKHYATGQFVELVFENRSSEGYYIVQNAYVGLKVYANKTIMFDPDMERVAVEREYLKAQLYNPNSTLWMDLDLGQPRVRVDVNNDSMIVVTRLFDNEQGKLEVSYIMRPGEYLKHNISLTSRVGVGQKYRLVNVFDGIHGTRLSYVNGTGLINEVSNVTRLLELKPPLLTVRSKSANVLSMNLRDLERLDSETGRWREADLEKVVIEPTASGLRAAIHFGSRTLRRARVSPSTH